MTEKELIEEAKIRYPIGTKYVPAHLGEYISDEHVCVVYSHDFKYWCGGARRPVIQLGCGNKEKNGNVYTENLFYEGKWADIVSSPDVITESRAALLEEARKRYPVGTVYKSNQSEFSYGESIVEPKDVIRFRNKESGNIDIQFKGWIYYNEEWSTIVQPAKTLLKEFLYNIGDVVDTNENGYQYINYNVNPISGSKFPSSVRKSLKILQRAVGIGNDFLWYDVGMGNWYTEESLTLCKKEVPVEKDDTPNHHGDFKKGDWVEILRGSGNWTVLMDSYIGRVVQITGASEHSIRFNDDGGWEWQFNHGHFRRVELQGDPKKEKYQIPPSTNIKTIPTSAETTGWTHDLQGNPFIKEKKKEKYVVPMFIAQTPLPTVHGRRRRQKIIIV